MPYYRHSGKIIEGPNPNLKGNCTGLKGDCTGLRGDCAGLKKKRT